jgi:hypothetical protein
MELTLPVTSSSSSSSSGYVPPSIENRRRAEEVIRKGIKSGAEPAMQLKTVLTQIETATTGVVRGDGSTGAAGTGTR